MQTMNITVTCGGCGQKLSAPEQFGGRRVPCPKCRTPVDVPTAAPTQDALAPSKTNPAALMPAARLEAGVSDLELGQPAAPQAAARSAGRSNRPAALMIAVIVVLLLAGGGIGAWMMLSSKAGVGSDLRYIPDDSDVVASADANGIISSGAGQKIKSQASELFAALNRRMPKDSKFKPEDVGRITIGVRVQGSQGAGVIHMTRAVTDQEFLDAGKAVKKTVGQYQMYVNGKTALCRIDDRTIVFGEEEVLRKILDRNGPAKVSDELSAAMNEIDFSKSIAVAGSVKNLGGAGGPGGMGPMSMMLGGPSGIRGGALQADVGSDIRLKAVVLCKDASTADQLKKMADGFLNMAKANPNQGPPAATKVLDSLNISNSGATIRANLTIEAETLLSLLEPLKKPAIP